MASLLHELRALAADVVMSQQEGERRREEELRQRTQAMADALRQKGAAWINRHLNPKNQRKIRLEFQDSRGWPLDPSSSEWIQHCLVFEGEELPIRLRIATNVAVLTFACEHCQYEVWETVEDAKGLAVSLFVDGLASRKSHGDCVAQRQAERERQEEYERGQQEERERRKVQQEERGRLEEEAAIRFLRRLLRVGE